MDDFYRAFEERHRGSRDLIKQRLEVYLPFVTPLLDFYPDGRVLDLGCGRGEWLELMSSLGFEVYGVDLDDGMLSASRELGINVEKLDVLDALKKADESSMTIVTAFHLVEHVHFDRVREIVAQAMRVLVPGGLLIMETPNPENIIVAGCNFYLDPTHERPIPPSLLSFVAEHEGFFKVKVVRLHEPSNLRDQNSSIDLLDVLGGVSPDYAVVAQKKGEGQINECNKKAFHNEYGHGLDKLASRYTNQSQNKIQQVEAKAELIQEKAEQAISNLNDIYTSKSWRITAPLRWFSQQIYLLRQQGFKKRVKAVFRKILQHFISFINNKPRLKRLVTSVARSLGLEKFLRPIYMSSTHDLSLQNVHKDFNHLTPSSIAIYKQLKSAVKNKKRPN